MPQIIIRESNTFLPPEALGTVTVVYLPNVGLTISVEEPVSSNGIIVDAMAVFTDLEPLRPLRDLLNQAIKD